MSEEKAQETIQKLLDRLTKEEVTSVVQEGVGTEYGTISKAFMAWYRLLIASNIFKNKEKAAEVLAGSMLVLGTMVKTVYALGIYRGQKMQRVPRKRPRGQQQKKRA